MKSPKPTNTATHLHTLNTQNPHNNPNFKYLHTSHVSSLNSQLSPYSQTWLPTILPPFPEHDHQTPSKNKQE